MATEQSPKQEIPEWLWPILNKRGIHSADDIDYRLSRLIHPKGLKDLDKAIDLIVDALERDLLITIAGDYDVDGATGTALAMKALTAFGSKHVNYQIPNRFEQGYGLSAAVVERLHQQGTQLLITVDNGTTCHEAIERAYELGVKTIITDHHLPENALPRADAIINPNQPDCHFHCKTLAGVGVIFYVLSAVRTRLREQHWFVFRKIREPVMTDFLDLVALGTIADMAPLDYNNRVLVESGLRKIRQGKSSLGIRCLLQLSGVKIKNCTSRDIAFSIAPPLNAVGRLDSMDKGIDWILSHSWNNAYQHAEELIRVNNERKKIQAKMTRQALQMIEKTYSDAPLPELLVLYHDDWHQGITGVVAGNIKESHQVSCIILTSASETFIKGSGRACDNLHLRDLLQHIHDNDPDILTAFGGHAVAAGMTMHQDQLAQFRQRIDQHLDQFIDRNTPVEPENDGSFSLPNLTIDNARLLEKIGPWGNGFAEPVFCDTFTISEQSLVAQRHLRMVLSKDSIPFPAIAFSVDTNYWPNKKAQQVRVYYNLHINRFQGKETLQLTVSRITPC